MTVATVLVPTHDHGPTLYESVASALRQTIQDLEVFVVGDGVPNVTREVMAQLIGHDERVRFFDNPKGARHGELHRHAALAHASGRIICYLADDDLWLPDHVEVMLDALDGADFAHTLPCVVRGDSSVATIAVDLANEWFRQDLLGGTDWLSLSFAGHTLASYRGLPNGWRTTPTGTPTDSHMWRQFLSDAACRVRAVLRPTAVKFTSDDRAGVTAGARRAEMAEWAERLADPAGLREFLMGVATDLARRAAAQTPFLPAFGETERELAAVRGTRTWRLHEFAARVPAVRWAARRLGPPRTRPRPR